MPGRECIDVTQLDALVLNQSNEWSLACLENVFLLALEKKSKCLIQACIFVVERGFGGVASFGQHTQVKFLLESIRHIVSENCQDEFPNVMRYIKLLHSLCPPGRAEISYINSILKIKQSCILYMLLSNNGASSICQILEDFFPDDNILKSFNITEKPTRRFMSVVKRQIHYFKNLVEKLLNDTGFRSSYFYDEWTLEYGEMFRVGMKSDIESYLRHVEFCLLSERNLEELFSVWVEMDSIRNPAMLYFLKLIMTSHDDKLSENDIRKFLMWLFPHPDFNPLDLQNSISLDCHSAFCSVPFRKILSKGGWSLGCKKPWDFECLQSFAKFFLATGETNNSSSAKCGQDVLSGNLGREILTPSGLKVPLEKEVHQTKRLPFQIINGNVIRKRKWNQLEHDFEVKAKRLCLQENTESAGAIVVKNLIVNMRKNNACLGTSETPLERAPKVGSAFKLGVDSPQCKDLLMSSSKFFSGRCQRRGSDETPLVAEMRSSSICHKVALFSTESDADGDSEKLMSNEENSLIWIPISYNGKPACRKNMKKPRRTLCFKSPSTEEQVSESEFEDLVLEYLPANISFTISADHQVIIPDLTMHDKNTAEMLPCFVKLQNLSTRIIRKNGKYTLSGCKISHQKDIRILLTEDETCWNRCLRNSCKVVL